MEGRRGEVDREEETATRGYGLLRGGGTYDDGGAAVGRPHGQTDDAAGGLMGLTGMGDHDHRSRGGSAGLAPLGLDGLHDDAGLLLGDRSGRELDADVGVAVAGGAGDVAGGRVDDGHGLRRRWDRLNRHGGLQGEDYYSRICGRH